MLVGVPKEIKIEEHRVGLTPYCVHELNLHKHRVLILHNTGADVGFTDNHYHLPLDISAYF